MGWGWMVGYNVQNCIECIEMRWDSTDYQTLTHILKLTFASPTKLTPGDTVATGAVPSLLLLALLDPTLIISPVWVGSFW